MASDRQREPFGGAGDQPPDLHRGQRDVPIVQVRLQIGGGERAGRGHDLTHRHL
jgi:hypothetical protein